MFIDEERYIEHYGIIRRSGRYPWGSGGNVEIRSRTFLDMIADLRRKGMTDTEIARGLKMTTTELRATNSIARNARRQADAAMAQRLKDKGNSNGAIAKRMGLPGESSVRALLAAGVQDRANRIHATADMLRDQVEKKGFVDVGIGTEHYVNTGISRNQLDTAISVLKAEGYSVIKVQEDQLGTGQKTIIKVLAPPGTTYRDVVTQKENIKSLAVNTVDGKTFIEPLPPLKVNPNRVAIKYAEDGGSEADGVIYVRPGVEDISLGGGQYAQVRVAVGDGHYLKGMAVYKDDLPEGVDLQFNTNKSNTGNKLDALKPIKNDPEDPFGAVTRQITKVGPGGKQKVTSAMNIVNEEGDWDDWSQSLASQMLSKQKPTVVKEQLDKTYSQKKQDFDEIMSLTNPTVRKTLLDAYADDVDSSAVHLKAAQMPRQATKVIMPINSMKDTEIYAPSFRDGERVALIRYPHGGTFEIPELTVNNKVPAAKKILGDNPLDAVGINHKVAARLSGADFDGDTVLVIPNNSGKINSTPALEGLKNFDPKVSYPQYDGMPKMTPKQKQTEMGKISNLITDMTIKGANTNEISRAVRHSMVVIDAEKWDLDYKRSAVDNGIAQLKEKYQGGATKGASTLISRSTSEMRVPKRKQHYTVDKLTGEKIFTETGESYVKTTVNKKTGQVRERTILKETKTTQGAEAKDAHTLSSGTRVERIYADHANRLKALANAARKESINTQNRPYSPSAKKVYHNEVATLNAKLNVALKNAPLERQAQILASATVRQKRRANPDMSNDEVKKIESKALIESRARVQAGKNRIDITDSEWEAIQAGAISTNKLSQILRNSDLDKVKKLATPRQPTVMTSAKQTRARQLLSSGRTASEVADILGVPLSTLKSSMDK